MKRARLVVLVASCVGCPSATPDPRPAADGAPPADPASSSNLDEAARRRAHEQALQRFHAAALPALSAFDPASAAELGRGSPMPPPISSAARQPLREAAAVARREREGIDPSLLAPQAAVLFRALEHGTIAIDDELAGRTPITTEPGVYLDRVEPLLVDLERGLSRGELSAAEASAALEALATELKSVPSRLHAVSSAAIEAAIADARTLASRLRKLPAMTTDDDEALARAAEDAAAAAEDVASRLHAIALQLPKARAQERGARSRPVTDPAAMPRLPDRLGAEGLAVALAREAIAEPPSVILSRVVLQIARLHAMADALPPAPAERADPVTAARCEAAWKPVAAFVATQAPSSDALEDAALDCDAFARRHADTPMDDADLGVALVHEGVVVPTRRARRQKEDPALALVSGDATPHAQAQALAISVLAGAGMQAAGRRATERARDDACLAGAALLVHGQAEGTVDVTGRLGAGCSHRSSEAWIADALARPHRSLHGLGLTLIGSGPADALAMQRFWWVPMGLVRPLAQPPAIPKREPPPADVKIEPLEPTP